MKEVRYEFSQEKNKKLKEQRDVSFDLIIDYINRGYLLDTIRHHNQEKYEGQKFYVVDVDDYVYLVPFEEREEVIFLKTIFPSRKQTKKYIKDKQGKGDVSEK